MRFSQDGSTSVGSIGWVVSGASIVMGVSMGACVAGLHGNFATPSMVFDIFGSAVLGGGAIWLPSIVLDGSLLCNFCIARSVVLSERRLLSLLPDVALDVERDRFLVLLDVALDGEREYFLLVLEFPFALLSIHRAH